MHSNKTIRFTRISPGRGYFAVGACTFLGLLGILIGPGCNRQHLPEPAPALATKDAEASSQDILEAGDRTFRSRRYVEARRTYQEAATAAEKEGQRNTRVEALAQVARTYSMMGEGERGEPWLNQAAALARESDPIGWSRYRLVLGVYQREAGQREEATQTFMDLYAYCLKNNLHERAIDAAHMVAIAADLETQILWGRKGIAAAEAGGHEQWLGPLWNNLGWTYDDLGRYEESLQALIEARKHHYNGGGYHAKLVADWSVGHAHRMVGELDIAREWMLDVYERAKKRYNEQSNADTAEWVGHSARELGELAHAVGQEEEAYAYMREAVQRLKEAKMPEWDLAGFEELVDRERAFRQVLAR